MLLDRRLVALPLVPFVLLIVAVKDECDDVVEVIDKVVRRRRVDQPVEAIVEGREVMETRIDIGEQLLRLLLESGGFPRGFPRA